MATVSDIVNVSISLSSVPASQANFGVPMLLIDHADIPIDRRFRILTRASLTNSDLTASTTQLAWFQALWGQNLNIAEAYIGRWVSAASSPYIVFNSVNETITDWTGTADGTMTITDGTNDDDLTALDFSSVTSVADICTVIQTKIQAIGAPNITGLDTATCFVDIIGRVIIQNSTTGASAATISAEPEGTGTDITGSGFLGTDFSQAGLDAESLSTALNATLSLDNTPYMIAQNGGSIAQVVAFSTAVNSLKKKLILVSNDVDTKDSSATTDFVVSTAGETAVTVTASSSTAGFIST